jgi:putative aldouronate transport system substrate-binding protein
MRRTLVTGLALLALLAVFATGAMAQAVPGAPTIRVMVVGLDEQGKKLWDQMQKPLGFNIEWVIASWDNWAQKVNTMMATGEQLDLIDCEESLPWREWVDGGLVMPLDSLIDPKTMPYTDLISKSTTFGGYTVGGKRYILPNIHQGVDQGVVVRKDIMDKLGAKEIKDMDQYYDLMVKAKKQFGVYGFAMSLDDGLMNLQSATHVFAAFGGGGFIPQSRSFVVNNNVVSDLSVSEGTKKSLVFLNKLYREGLVNKDYATIKSGFRATYLDTGKTFSWYGPPVNAPGSNEKMKAIDKTMSYAAIPAIAKDSKTFQPVTNGFNMWTVCFVPATAKYPKEALRLYEYTNSKEGREMLVGGFKGVTYTDAGFDQAGVYEAIPAGLKAEWGSEGATSPRWWGAFATVYGYVPLGRYKTFEEAYKNEMIFTTKKDLAANDPFSLRNILQICKPYSSTNAVGEVPLAIETEVKAKLNNIKGEYWNKIIMASDAAVIDKLWAEYVAKWKAGGGDAYAKAYQDYYNAMKK